MLTLSTLLKYYKREDIQNAILENGEGKEVAVRFGDKGFGKRPDVLHYPKDVLELAKVGATSFHISEEHWKNPLQLSPNMRKEDQDELRSGWDLVLDIDCKVLEYSKIAAEIVAAALKHHGIDSLSCKFSGNKGFHLAVPYEAFPKKVKGLETRLLFPDAARRIAMYLRDMIKEPIATRIIEEERGDFSRIIQKTEKTRQELVLTLGGKTVLNTEAFLEIDTVLISSRHLYRSVYSLNEKSGLSSIPVRLKEVSSFSKEMANPENVIVEDKFLDRKKAEPGEATKLFTQGFDYNPKVEKKETPEARRQYIEIEGKIPEANFAPCIKNILNGLTDGRKRGVFVLMNYLTSCGWGYDDIKILLNEWNKKNKEPLREVSIVGPVRYHQQHKKKILPPNCDSAMYYKEIGVCTPDALCKKIRNPVNYSRLRTKKRIL